MGQDIVARDKVELHSSCVILEGQEALPHNGVLLFKGKQTEVSSCVDMALGSRLAVLNQVGIFGHLPQHQAWRGAVGGPSQTYLQKLDHIHRPLGSQVWRGILFGGGLGFSVQQSQSWRGARARGCGDKQWLLWGSLGRERARKVRLHGDRYRGGIGDLACFCLGPLNLDMRLSWSVRRYGWEARLFYSCLGPFRLLGDLRHLAAWWLAKL